MTAITDNSDQAVIERLREVISGLVSNDGRFIVLCDDGSLIATDDLMDGDDVIVDRGADW